MDSAAAANDAAAAADADVHAVMNPAAEAGATVGDGVATYCACFASPSAAAAVCVCGSCN